MLFFYRKNKWIALLGCSLIVPYAVADKLNQAIKVDMATNQAAVKSQNKIDKLSDQTRKMLEEYRSATRQTESLQVYNDYIKDLINSQLEEKSSLHNQLQEIEITQREIVPLILTMLNNLETFIQLDLPFLPEERQQRTRQLQDMMLRADVTDAEKFRRIIEAYQIENDYGNTIEAYRAILPLQGKETAVDFLRLGRVALYYRRLDGSETGFWNNQEKRWQTLSTDYDHMIGKGLSIARKEAAPDLLVLPIPAAKTVK